jgi:hypothetical protein
MLATAAATCDGSIGQAKSLMCNPSFMRSVLQGINRDRTGLHGQA